MIEHSQTKNKPGGTWSNMGSMDLIPLSKGPSMTSKDMDIEMMDTLQPDFNMFNKQGSAESNFSVSNYLA